jgi:Adenylate and Guanylate cyclase catalytic domain
MSIAAFSVRKSPFNRDNTVTMNGHPTLAGTPIASNTSRRHPYQRVGNTGEFNRPQRRNSSSHTNSNSTSANIGSTTTTTETATSTTRHNWFDTEMGGGTSNSTTSKSVDTTASGSNDVTIKTSSGNTMRKRRNSLTLSQIWNDNKKNTCKACNKVRDVLSMKSLSTVSSSSSSLYNREQCECYLCAAIATTRQQIQLVFGFGILFWLVCILGMLQLIPHSILSLFGTIISEQSSTSSQIPLVSVITITFVSFGTQVLLSMRYDNLVYQRHQAISEISETSQNLVCDIYPETVRNRLMQSHTSWRKITNNSTNTEIATEEEEVDDEDNDDDIYNEDIDNSDNNIQNIDLVHQQFSNRRPRRRSTGDLPYEIRSTVSATGGGHGTIAAAMSSLPESSSTTTTTTPSVVTSTATTIPSILSKPIVDNYKSATVLFADIVGFTLWSSSHDPYQVFTYLETLYAAFDTAAAEQDIFKVSLLLCCILIFDET